MAQKTALEWHREGREAFARQDIAHAQFCLEQSVATQPTAAAYHDLGILFYVTGRASDAIRSLQQSAATDPHHAEAYGNLSRILYENGQVTQAIEASCLAIRHAPDNIAYKQDFARITQNLSFSLFYPVLKNTITECLRCPDLPHQSLMAPWLSMLENDPANAPILQLAAAQNYTQFRGTCEWLGHYTPLLEPYFLLGLQHLVITDSDFERFVAHMRRLILESALNWEEMSGQDILALACSVALYAFNTDYILDTDESERAMLERACARVTPYTPLLMAAVAAYKPLVHLDNADKLAAATYDGMVAELVRRTLRNPLAEAEIRKTIPALTTIDDTVSRDVRAQYEEFPYPRWSGIDGAVTHPQLHNVAPGRRVLNAGCGTGREALLCKAARPQAQLTAIDLSLASLAYAIRQSREQDVDDIRFAQADILKLGTLGTQYEVIFSAGVLHHMGDHDKGLQVLADILAPGGHMMLALYSERGRRDIIAVREAISKNNIGNDRDSIKAFRRDIDRLVDRKTVAQIRKRKDFYTLAECRDLLFHVQEHRFTPPMIAASLQRAGLEFTGFEVPPLVAHQYAAMFPADPHGLSLENWDRFEERYPDTFVNMFQFWCRKP